MDLLAPWRLLLPPASDQATFSNLLLSHQYPRCSERPTANLALVLPLLNRLGNPPYSVPQKLKRILSINYLSSETQEDGRVLLPAHLPHPHLPPANYSTFANSQHPRPLNLKQTSSTACLTWEMRSVLLLLLLRRHRTTLSASQQPLQAKTTVYFRASCKMNGNLLKT
jgi:hypothetical protein